VSRVIDQVKIPSAINGFQDRSGITDSPAGILINEEYVIESISLWQGILPFPLAISK